MNTPATLESDARAVDPLRPSDAVARPRPWLAAGTLCQRELVRFIRQRNRVVGALGQPLLFWLLFGAGLGPSFQLPGVETGLDYKLSYREYFFPGTLILILLFTAIFATISIIEDRREGFLQSVLVAPIPRWSMVLGKVLGGAAIAVLQGAIFLALGFTLHLTPGPIALVGSVGLMGVVSVALVSLGFVIAWRMDSTQGFHAIMSLFLLPMWLLSGAFFPPGSDWLGWAIRLNPLTYAVAGLRRLLYFDAAEDVRRAALSADLPSAALCAVVTVGFAVVMFALAWKVAATRSTADLL